MNNMKMGNCTHNILQFKVLKKKLPIFIAECRKTPRQH